MLGYSVFGSKKEQYLRNVFNDHSLIMADFVRNSILLLNLRKVNYFQNLVQNSQISLKIK